MKIIIRLILSTIAVLVADQLLSGVSADTWQTGLIVAIVLGLLNTFVRPLIILLTLPVTLVTLGLFILVINAGMVMLAARFVPGFVVPGLLVGARLQRGAVGRAELPPGTGWWGEVER